MDESEFRILRQRQAAGDAEATRLDDPRSPPPGPTLVKTVAVTSYPTAAGRVFAVQAIDVDFVEAEGATPTFTDVPGIFYALHVGATPPPLGTKAIAKPASGRWIIPYG